MARTISNAAKQAIFAQQTSKVFLSILTIDHSQLAQPIRVVNNRDNITSGGDLYQGYPFAFSLPDEDEETLSKVELTITNVDRLLVESVRSIATPLSVVLEVILADTPDTIEVGPITFSMSQVQYDALKLTGTCNFQDLLNEPYPEGSYTPSNYPGLF
jgi:hypothetical protein